MQNIATTTTTMPNHMYAVCQGYYDDLVTAPEHRFANRPRHFGDVQMQDCDN